MFGVRVVAPKSPKEERECAGINIRCTRPSKVGFISLKNKTKRGFAGHSSNQNKNNNNTVTTHVSESLRATAIGGVMRLTFDGDAMTEMAGASSVL